MNCKNKIIPVVLLYCCIIAKALQFEEFDYKKDFNKNLEKEYPQNFLDEKNIEAEIDTDFDDDEDFESDLESNFEAIFKDDFEPDYEKDLEKRILRRQRSFCKKFKLCEKGEHGFKTGCAKFEKTYVYNRSFPRVWKKKAAKLCVECQELCRRG
uniref:uncharacterized protein LOC120335334 n=1 Tax=Styela clava TaxID=7725 RepID=UPI001939DB62|nr:uncharacterized protein LOC120335334 [Styela clava]